jgi:hypothetical protein
MFEEAFKLLMKSLKKDSRFSRVGVGTRTRDTLLGRQGVAKSPLARYRLAAEDDQI